MLNQHKVYTKIQVFNISHPSLGLQNSHGNLITSPILELDCQFGESIPQCNLPKFSGSSFHRKKSCSDFTNTLDSIQPMSTTNHQTTQTHVFTSYIVLIKSYTSGTFSVPHLRVGYRWWRAALHWTRSHGHQLPRFLRESRVKRWWYHEQENLEVILVGEVTFRSQDAKQKTHEKHQLFHFLFKKVSCPLCNLHTLLTWMLDTLRKDFNRVMWQDADP